MLAVESWGSVARIALSRALFPARFWLAGAALLITALFSCAAYGSAANVQLALDALTTSIARTKAGDYAGARSALERVREIVAAEGKLIADFETKASEAWSKCVSTVGELDVKIGEITTTEERVSNELRLTESTLDQALRDGKLSAQELASIEQRITELQARVGERQAKLQELERWWWVPGYGFYLAIRTLADNDVGEMNALLRTVADERVQQSRTSQTLTISQAAAARLGHERSRLEAERAAATAVHNDLEQRMLLVRDVTAFISDAKQFWKDMETLMTYHVQGAVGSTTVFANRLADMLKQQGSDAIMIGIDRQHANLGSKLLELSNRLEQGQGYTALAATQCAPAPGAVAGAEQVKPCNLTPSPFYRIVNFKTCEYRNVNPPGCPPALKGSASPAQSSPDFPQKTKARGLIAENRNWIGRARCTSPDAIFLGRFAAGGDPYSLRRANAAICEEACLANAECRFWTYNFDNGVWGGNDGPKECWGGTKNLMPEEPQASSNAGIFSGGVPCVEGQTAKLCRR